MKKIRMKDEYYWYGESEYIELPDEIAAVFEEDDREEENYKRKVRYHRAFYSLDAGDDIEHCVLFVSESPAELYERKLTFIELHKAISLLPKIQRSRLVRYYFEEKKMAEIAIEDNVSEKAVSATIEKAEINIEKILKNLI